MSCLCSLSIILNHLGWNMCPSRYWGKWLWAIPVMGKVYLWGSFWYNPVDRSLVFYIKRYCRYQAIDAASPEEFCSSVMISEITHWSPLLGTYFLCFDLFRLPVRLFLLFDDVIDLIFCGLLSHLHIPSAPIQSICSAFILGLRESDPRGSSPPPLLLFVYFRLPASWK